MNIHKLIAAQVYAGLAANRREWDTEEGMFAQALAVADTFSERYDAARPEEQGPAKSPARLAADAIKAERERRKKEGS